MVELLEFSEDCVVMRVLVLVEDVLFSVAIVAEVFVMKEVNVMVDVLVVSDKME